MASGRELEACAAIIQGNQQLRNIRWHREMRVPIRLRSLQRSPLRAGFRLVRCGGLTPSKIALLVERPSGARPIADCIPRTLGKSPVAPAGRGIGRWAYTGRYLPMGPSSDSQFVHRANGDGTFDSICRECIATVAAAKREAELEAAEQDHICDSWILRRYAASYPKNSS